MNRYRRSKYSLGRKKRNKRIELLLKKNVTDHLANMYVK